ncbi:MAG: hypothetical protein ACTSYU_09980 [Promethearchaeota archaeon]
MQTTRCHTLLKMIRPREGNQRIFRDFFPHARSDKFYSDRGLKPDKKYIILHPPLEARNCKNILTTSIFVEVIYKDFHQLAEFHAVSGSSIDRLIGNGVL